VVVVELRLIVVSKGGLEGKGWLFWMRFLVLFGVLGLHLSDPCVLFPLLHFLPRVCSALARQPSPHRRYKR